ncbi:MAG: fumarylacetoacetate hydrolase family protein [Gammaproteobacteria bacterium]|uniref:fumarylacetoacetate hydrolase family protein n=1 Tax=Rhodoferax sp. TaxID=50421 RepID=UPI00183ED3FA|nr:fumarylacetoacetate hydrolase family protein [Rhodoferax sp.]MBU3900227.1 fumarylacetoacetate hydrolase family protein [Gammaproteobacteria bacterium]MBA3057940.1 fumarylacetoacetate hydrolase [Rhodoferax sp.]MBU3997987.1 fumarylacetoacetate hydrolase family protein [Gammaproteobacteria bacterium]MBU4079435.1 fumarylacetoacetate hydrolase family protein [Gammaproteobacteria bacterium]MBU4114396.1 fumarylacetoacetate hydrolase family protein [Gammaproteobacteria bacterium]
MKLATYKDGSRDGQLVVVARDLSVAHYATGIAHRLQQVLDDWNFLSPQLQDLYDALNRSRDSSGGASPARHAFPFDPRQCMAPLPRAYQWVNGAAYRNPETGPAVAGKGSSPRLYQGASDDFLGPCDEVRCASEAEGIDFEAEVAVIIGDVRPGATPAQALDGIRLLLLANALCLRQYLPDELAQGFGPLHSRPATAFSPVAVTPDEVGADWAKGRLSLTLQSSWNGRKVGLCEAGPEMRFHFGQLVAHLCKTRRLRAGAIIGAGAVSNQDASHGYSCIADKRALETLQDGQPLTEFMKFGDTIRIEMKGRDGQSVFGAIEQEIVPMEPATSAP